MARSVVEFTTGPPGSGKSYRRCAVYLLDELLNPDVPGPTYFWSNYPIEFDEWEGGQGLCALAKDKYGLEDWEVKERVRVFPEDVVDVWARSADSRSISGPWDYFRREEISLAETHVAIDEIHNFCPAESSKANRAWNGWLGEIRHEGATIEFLTQSPHKVGKAISKHAELRRQLVTGTSRRDPFFNIAMGDWYNVLTLFGKPYQASSWQIEQRNELGRWKTTDQIPFWFRADYFEVYNSHSASHATGSAGTRQLEPYELLTKKKLAFWFLKRNGARFFWNRYACGLVFLIGIYFATTNFGVVSKWISGSLQSEKKTSDVVSERELDVLDEIVSDLPDESEAKASLDQLRFEVAQIEAERDRKLDAVVEYVAKFYAVDEIVAIAPGEVIFASGQRASVGDWVELVVNNEKKKIEQINYRKRFVTYADGSRGFMRRPHGMLERARSQAQVASELRERLRGGEGPATDILERGRAGQGSDTAFDR